MKHFVIGDVHGAGEELEALIDKMGPSSDDQVILVGDVFDRGLRADKVWDIIQGRVNQVFMGNHEYKMMAWMQGRREWLPKAYYVAMNILMAHGVAPQELLTWLEGRPLLGDYPGFIVTHAAVDPSAPLVENVSWNVYGTSPDRVPLKVGEKQVYFWDVYDGEKLVVYGHLVCPDNLPRIRRNASGAVNSVGLDTAAVHGGPITGVCVEDFRFYSHCSGVDWGKRLEDMTKGKVLDIDPGLMAFVTSQREALKARMETEKSDKMSSSGTLVG